VRDRVADHRACERGDDESQAAAWSDCASVSGDGRYVAFIQPPTTW